MLLAYYGVLLALRVLARVCSCVQGKPPAWRADLRAVYMRAAKYQRWYQRIIKYQRRWGPRRRRCFRRGRGFDDPGVDLKNHRGHYH